MQTGHGLCPLRCTGQTGTSVSLRPLWHMNWSIRYMSPKAWSSGRGTIVRDEHECTDCQDGPRRRPCEHGGKPWAPQHAPAEEPHRRCNTDNPGPAPEPGFRRTGVVCGARRGDLRVGRMRRCGVGKIWLRSRHGRRGCAQCLPLYLRRLLNSSIGLIEALNPTLCSVVSCGPLLKPVWMPPGGEFPVDLTSRIKRRPRREIQHVVGLAQCHGTGEPAGRSNESRLQGIVRPAERMLLRRTI